MKDSSLTVCGSGLFFVGDILLRRDHQILLYKHKNDGVFLLCKVKIMIISLTFQIDKFFTRFGWFSCIFIIFAS